MDTAKYSIQGPLMVTGWNQRVCPHFHIRIPTAVQLHRVRRVGIASNLRFRIVGDAIAIRVSRRRASIQISRPSHRSFIRDELSLRTPGLDLGNQLRINTVAHFGRSHICITLALNIPKVFQEGKAYTQSHSSPLHRGSFDIQPPGSRTWCRQVPFRHSCLRTHPARCHSAFHPDQDHSSWFPHSRGNTRCHV